MASISLNSPVCATRVPEATVLLSCLPPLRRYARALRRNREDADDLVQDTLERAWARAGLWQGVGDMRTWLFSIMHNLHVDALRRGRLELVDLDEYTPEVPVAGAQSEHLALRDLDVALAALPPDPREVLMLVALDGLAYAEIAQVLGIPIGTVMSRLSRGRERLRCLIESPAARRPGATAHPVTPVLGGRGIPHFASRPRSVAPSARSFDIPFEISFDRSTHL
jgi:RNA polymerase sigma-70 factor (ECF subfamily)